MLIRFSEITVFIEMTSINKDSKSLFLCHMTGLFQQFSS